jgi:hypothetical protein
MDLESVIQTFETYAVDYVRYILSLFGREAFRRRAPDLEKKLFSFALISALLGSYLDMKYVSGLPVGESDLATPVITEFSIWIALSVVVWVGMGVARSGHQAYTPALDAVLRVLPVTYVIGAYVGFLMTNVAHVWTWPTCAAWQGYFSILLVRFGLVAAFMPLSIAISNTSLSRARTIAAVVAIAVLAIQAGSFIAKLSDQAVSECKADKACAALSGAARLPAIHLNFLRNLMAVRRCL